MQAEILKFSNYYQVLEVDEDYFPDQESFVQDRGASKKAKAERRRLFDEAFAQDLQMEVVCYFMELEGLVQGVFNVHEQVKKQQKSMMEATVVSTLALMLAKELTAKLQLRYPALELAQDLVGCWSATRRPVWPVTSQRRWLRFGRLSMKKGRSSSCRARCSTTSPTSGPR